jgi:hypothetical protein
MARCGRHAFDVFVQQGGVAISHALRAKPKNVAFVTRFVDDRKPIAAIWAPAPRLAAPAVCQARRISLRMR